MQILVGMYVSLSALGTVASMGIRDTVGVQVRVAMLACSVGTLHVGAACVCAAIRSESILLRLSLVASLGLLPMSRCFRLCSCVNLILMTFFVTHSDFQWS